MAVALRRGAEFELEEGLILPTESSRRAAFEALKDVAEALGLGGIDAYLHALWLEREHIWKRLPKEEA